MMMELAEVSDLIPHTRTGRNPSFHYGRTEVDYERFVSTMNKSYLDTIHYAKSAMVHGSTVNSYLASGFVGDDQRIVNLNKKHASEFLISIATGQSGGAPSASLNRRMGTIIATSKQLLSESPFIRSVFHRAEYVAAERPGIYVIPVAEYFIAILIRDMFLEKYKYTCYDARSPCPYGPAAARSRGLVKSLPDLRENTEIRSPIVAPLSASLGRRRTSKPIAK